MKKVRALVLMGMALALVAGACSSGSSDSAEVADTSVSEAATSDGADVGDDGTAAEEPTAEPAETSGTYEPGPIEFRAVNLLDVPVGIYVRSTGLVEAFVIHQGVAPGAVTGFVAPPEGGKFVVTDADFGLRIRTNQNSPTQLKGRTMRKTIIACRAAAMVNAGLGGDPTTSDGANDILIQALAG
jgi:hypothetical protein